MSNSVYSYIEQMFIKEWAVIGLTAHFSFIVIFIIKIIEIIIHINNYGLLHGISNRMP